MTCDVEIVQILSDSRHLRSWIQVPGRGQVRFHSISSTGANILMDED